MSGRPAQNQQAAPLPPVSSSAAANSHSESRRGARMNAIPAAASGPPRSLTTASISTGAVVAPIGLPGRDSTSQPVRSSLTSAISASSSAQLSSQSTSSALSSTFDPERLYKVYLEVRKEAEELKAVNTALRNTIATMAIKESATKGRQRGPQKLDETEDIDITDTKFALKMEKYARWCLIFRACYIARTHFFELDKDSLFGVDDPIRFLDEDHIDKGITEDLRDAIPKQFHNLFSVCAEGESKPNDPISKFRSAASVARSNFLKMLKDHTSGIFNVPELDSSFPPENRFNVSRIRYLIGYKKDPKTSEVTFSRFFPAICLNEDDSDLDNAFFGEMLYRIGRGIVFNAGAIFKKENAIARSTSQFVRADKPTRTTVGFISLCCVVSRFLLSTDKQFDNSGKGLKSSITYKDDYLYYHQFLLNSATLNPSWLVELKADWDSNVFGKQLQSKEGLSLSGDIATTSASGAGIIDRAAEITQHLQGMRIRSDDDPNQRLVDAQSQSIPPPSKNVPAPDDIDYNDIYGDEPEAPVWRLMDNAPQAAAAQAQTGELSTDAVPISPHVNATNVPVVPESDVNVISDQRRSSLNVPSTITPALDKPRKQSQRAPTVAPASTEASEQRRSSRLRVGTSGAGITDSNAVGEADSQPVTGCTTVPASINAPAAASKKGRTRGAKRK
ncbi:hypothetical protein GALMADRAFT_148365 [Galerina marginata CBS 339.88]|uniref:Uncharacterized protein n=1 Tax=Galerina marginata (strain CBS 339.88) TaxID=685588 RepID=A0A067S7K8_GALM3|nr:hypothetical protein GALMADRAFT_148365 [Galerina marginata CBS 339.88]